MRLLSNLWKSRKVAHYTMQKSASLSSKTVTLPKSMMEGFTIMPIISLKDCDISNYEFSWFRRISSDERDKMLKLGVDRSKFESQKSSIWLRLCNEFTYCPTNDDVGHQLRFVCWSLDGNSKWPRVSLTSRGGVEMKLLEYPFESRHVHTKFHLDEANKFRVVTYNILADAYADSDYSREVLFAHCPAHALSIDYRRQLLLKEICGYKADIICLQEVDKKEFARTYQRFLKMMANSTGMFAAKGGHLPEGCATFIRDDKFDIIESHTTSLADLIDPHREDKCKMLKYHPILNDLECLAAKDLLSRFEDIRAAILANSSLHKRFVDRTTIIQTSLLRMKQVPDVHLIVANTHLYFAPDADHIRLLQSSICIRYLEYLKSFHMNNLSEQGDCIDKVFIVLCGDMNSTPDDGVYKFLTTGEADKDCIDWLSNDIEKVSNLDLKTTITLTSAYKDIEYTNYTPEFKGCLDYIYYEHYGATCYETVPMPNHEDVIATGGIPSDIFPSDHLPLIANFEINL